MVHQFSAGSCYSYIVSSDGKALIIDPHISLLDEYRTYLKRSRLVLTAVVDTHTHADHFSLAAVLKEEFSVPVSMHPRAVSAVADRRLDDNAEIAVGSLRLKVLYTPGHTDDAISLWGDGAVFTGDVLLIGSVGRSDFQNGSPESMFDSLARLAALPGTTILFPGHDYRGRKRSTIDAEKRENPFLRYPDKSAFAAAMRARHLEKPFNMDNVIRVNQKGEATRLALIEPAAARALVAERRAKLIDVRSPAEYAAVHIADSLPVPIDQLVYRIPELVRTGDAYIVLCRTGNRSAMAADALLQGGVASVKILDGGIERWTRERLPLVKGTGRISLERQVRTIAGSLVVAGILGAYLVHPWCIGLSLFVGCGLIFAGVTDSCLMGMLLMRLPYNRQPLAAPGGGTCAMGG